MMRRGGELVEVLSPLPGRTSLILFWLPGVTPGSLAALPANFLAPSGIPAVCAVKRSWNGEDWCLRNRSERE